MGLTNPSQEAASEYLASANISGPLAQRIKSQVHEPPDETEIHAAQRVMCQVKNRYLKEKLDQVKGSVSGETLRAVDLATQKGASSWLTVLSIRDMNFDLNKSEFQDAVKLRYDWDVPDMPSVCVCGDHFNVDHAMICKKGGFVIQRHNELRDLQAGNDSHGATGYCSKGIMGKAEVGFLRCENLPPKYRLLQGYGSKPDLQAT